MKQLHKYFKILLIVFAIVGIVLLVTTIIAYFLAKPVPTMTEEELKQFADYTIFDGNLYCLEAEAYLGTVTSEIDHYFVRNANQHFYKIKELGVSEGVLSYSKGVGAFANNSDSIVLMFPKDAQNPLFSWNIESIEICEMHVIYDIDDDKDPLGYEGITSYNREKFESTKGEKKQIIENHEKIDAFLQSLKANYDTTQDIPSYETCDRILNGNGAHLSIKLSFRNNPNLIWLAQIYIDDTEGQIYLNLIKPTSETKGLKRDCFLIPISIDVDKTLFE